MRIGFVSQYFAPEPGAAAHPTVVARALADRGHDVVTITGFPSYPTGRIYAGYRQRLRQTEQIAGMTVHRVPYFMSHDSSAARRATSMASFGLSAAMQARLLRDVDVVLVYASPATTAIPAMALRALAGKPYVLYIQDLWPDSVTASGFVGGGRTSNRIEAVLHRACGLMYQRSSRIAVIAPGMREVLVSRGVLRDKVDVVPNWVDESVFLPTAPDPTLKRWFAERGDFTVMYAGGIGELQGLDVAIDAMAELRDVTGIHLAMVGEGVTKDRLVQRAKRLGLNNVSFWGGRPLAEMPAIMAAADAQLVSLRNRPLFRSTIPSKVQAAMACGLPLIVTAPGDAADLVTRAGAGLAGPPESPAGLAAALTEMHSLPVEQRRAFGRRAADYYRTHLSEGVGAERLEQLLHASLRGSRGNR